MTTASDIRHAHHEAGHAVAAVHRGGFVQEVQLAGDDPDDIGYVKHWSSPGQRAVRDLRRPLGGSEVGHHD